MGTGVAVGGGVAVGTGVAVGGGVAVDFGVAVGGTGVGEETVGGGFVVGVLAAVAAAVGDGVDVGRATVVGGGVCVAVAARVPLVNGTVVDASCPLDGVQAAKAIRRAAEKEAAAVSFKA